MSADIGRIALETEPFVSFHATSVGTGAPAVHQPVEQYPHLEEEPATWPDLAPAIT